MLPKLRKVLSLWLSSFKTRTFQIHIVFVAFFMFTAWGIQAVQTRSMISNLSVTGKNEVIVVEKVEAKELNTETRLIKGVAEPVKDKVADSKVQGATDTKLGAVPTTSNTTSGSNPLCKGILESWKMLPDPSHEGQYIICNTKSEKMTTVDELNSAQNKYRQDHGQGQLNINGELCKIASSRAAEVAKNFSHDGFESAVKGSGLGKSSYGENIASGPLSGVDFVQQSWDRSPGHKANMLADWTDGCGGVYDKYAVFLFAK